MGLTTGPGSAEPFRHRRRDTGVPTNHLAADHRAAGRPGPAVGVLRLLTAAGVLVSAAIHLYLYLTGFSGISVIGPLFLLNAIAGLILGVAVLAWRHWLPAFLSAGFGALTVLAYWYSVLFGLFGVREVTGGWSVILAEIAEYVAVLAGLAVTWMLATAGRGRGATPAPTQPLRAP